MKTPGPDREVPMDAIINFWYTIVGVVKTMTISDIFDDMTFGCGFKTKTPVNTEEDIIESFNTAVTKALKLYTQNPASWKLLIKNAINYNAGWTFDKIEKFNRIYSAL